MELSVRGRGAGPRAVVEALRAGGHEVAELARSTGVDLLPGPGLEEALTGAATVVDATNTPQTDPAKTGEFFQTATGNLLAAEERAGAEHDVLLSIVGLDDQRWGGDGATEARAAGGRGGPETLDFVAMARRTLDARGDQTRLRASRRDGPFTVEVAGEVLLPVSQVRLSSTAFEDWLTQQKQA